MCVLGDLGVPFRHLGVGLGGDVLDLLGLVRLARLRLAALCEAISVPPPRSPAMNLPRGHDEEARRTPASDARRATGTGRVSRPSASPAGPWHSHTSRTTRRRGLRVPRSGSTGSAPAGATRVRAGRRSPSPRTPRRPRSAYFARQRPRKYARVSSGGSCHGAGRSAASSSSRLHRAAGDQAVVEALLRPDVGVLQVDQLQLGVAQSRPVALRGSPRAAAAWPPSPARSAQRHRVAAPAGPAPHSQRCKHVDGLGVGIGAVRGRRRTSWRSSRYSHCRSRPVSLRPSRSVHRVRAASGRGRPRAARRTGPSTPQVGAVELLLDHRQHQRGGAHLEVGRDLRRGWRRR